MVDEGFTHVAVQSLHTIAGVEYHDLPKVVGSFKVMRGSESVFLGYPLLTTQNDTTHTVHQYLEPIPKERKKGEAVVLMGRGSESEHNLRRCYRYIFGCRNK